MNTKRAVKNTSLTLSVDLHDQFIMEEMIHARSFVDSCKTIRNRIRPSSYHGKQLKHCNNYQLRFEFMHTWRCLTSLCSLPNRRWRGDTCLGRIDESLHAVITEPYLSTREYAY